MNYVFLFSVGFVISCTVVNGYILLIHDFSVNVSGTLVRNNSSTNLSYCYCIKVYRHFFKVIHIYAIYIFLIIMFDRSILMILGVELRF